MDDNKYEEIVCTPEKGCVHVFDVWAWVGDHLLISAAIGLVLLVLAFFAIRTYIRMWRRPVRAAVTTVVWGAIGYFLWPYIGALPMLLVFFLVLLPISWFIGWAQKGMKPAPCPECEEYGQEYCSIHGSF